MEPWASVSLTDRYQAQANCVHSPVVLVLTDAWKIAAFRTAQYFPRQKSRCRNWPRGQEPCLHSNRGSKLAPKPCSPKQLPSLPELPKSLQEQSPLFVFPFCTQPRREVPGRMGRWPRFQSQLCEPLAGPRSVSEPQCLHLQSITTAWPVVMMRS